MANDKKRVYCGNCGVAMDVGGGCGKCKALKHYDIHGQRAQHERANPHPMAEDGSGPTTAAPPAAPLNPLDLDDLERKRLDAIAACPGITAEAIDAPYTLAIDLAEAGYRMPVAEYYEAGINATPALIARVREAEADAARLRADLADLLHWQVEAQRVMQERAHAIVKMEAEAERMRDTLASSHHAKCWDTGTGLLLRAERAEALAAWALAIAPALTEWAEARCRCGDGVPWYDSRSPTCAACYKTRAAAPSDTALLAALASLDAQAVAS